MGSPVVGLVWLSEGHRDGLNRWKGHVIILAEGCPNGKEPVSKTGTAFNGLRGSNPRPSATKLGLARIGEMKDERGLRL